MEIINPALAFLPNGLIEEVGSLIFKYKYLHKTSLQKIRFLVTTMVNILLDYFILFD